MTNQDIQVTPQDLLSFAERWAMSPAAFAPTSPNSEITPSGIPMLTDLEIVELAARRAYSVDYGVHAKNLFKIMADHIYTLQKERAEQEAKAHKEAMSRADETIGVS